MLFNDESMCQETYSIIIKTFIDSCPRSVETHEREKKGVRYQSSMNRVNVGSKVYSESIKRVHVSP